MKARRLEAAIGEYLVESRAKSLSQMFGDAGAAMDVFAGALGKRIRESLNEYLATQGQDTHSDKERLADALNRQLSKLRLAVKDPQSGDPAVIIVSMTTDGRGSFRFKSMRSSRSDYENPNYPTLPLLDLVPAASDEKSRCWAVDDLHRRPRPLPNFAR